MMTKTMLLVYTAPGASPPAHDSGIVAGGVIGAVLVIILAVSLCLAVFFTMRQYRYVFVNYQFCTLNVLVFTYRLKCDNGKEFDNMVVACEEEPSSVHDHRDIELGALESAGAKSLDYFEDSDVLSKHIHQSITWIY